MREKRFGNGNERNQEMKPAQALMNLRATVERPREDLFSQIYERKNITLDRERVAELKRRFTERESTPVAEIAELFTVRQLEANALCGLDTSAGRAAEFDDLVQGIDGWVLTPQKTERDFSGFGFDVTVGYSSLEHKLILLRAQLDRNALAVRPKYVTDGNGDPLSVPPELLKVILYLNPTEVQEMFDRYRSRTNSINTDELNAVLFGELAILTQTIERYQKPETSGYGKRRVERLFKTLTQSESSAILSLSNLEAMQTVSLFEYAEVVKNIFSIDVLDENFFDFVKPKITQEPGVPEIATEKLSTNESVLVAASPEAPQRWENATQASSRLGMPWNTFVGAVRDLKESYPQSVTSTSEGRLLYGSDLIQAVGERYQQTKLMEGRADALKKMGYVSVYTMCDVVKANEKTIQRVIDTQNDPSLFEKVGYARNKFVLLLSPQLQEVIIERLANDIPTDWVNAPGLAKEWGLTGGSYLGEKMERIVDRLVHELQLPRAAFVRNKRRTGKESPYYSPEVVESLRRDHAPIPDTFMSSSGYAERFEGSRKTLAKLLERIAADLPPEQRIVRPNADGRGNDAVFYGPEVLSKAEQMLPPKGWLAIESILDRVRLSNPKTVRVMLHNAAQGDAAYVRSLGTGSRGHAYWNPELVKRIFPEFDSPSGGV